MSTQPYTKLPREVLRPVPDDNEDTQVRGDLGSASPISEPMRPVTPIVKPRAIHAVTVEDPSALDVRPVVRVATRPAGKPQSANATLIGVRTPRAITAVPEQQPQQVAPLRTGRARAVGTPSPVPLFSSAQPIVAPTGSANETIMMAHAEHDANLPATVMIPQQAQSSLPVLAQPAILQGAPSTVIVGEVTDKKPVGKYHEYEQIGLGNQPSKVAKGAAKVVVSGYRLLGFSILTLIVAVLVGYITQTAFYFVSKSWVVPTVVSASDEKVVQLRTELAAQQNTRDKIQQDLDEADRAMKAELEFQAEFVDAIKADLAGRKVALGRVQALAGSAAATRNKITATNEAYARTAAERSQKELDAGLIDKDHALDTNVKLAGITDTQLKLSESEALYTQQAIELANQTKDLEALSNGKKTALSYEVVKIKRDYDASVLAYKKADESYKMLAKSLARQDEILSGLKQSAYLRALDDKAVVALVPYGNMDNAKPGTALVSCKVGMVYCHEVGKVLAVLPGEIQFKNPHRDAQVRGQMIELSLDDSDAATDEVLFVGGAPLGF